MDEMIGKKAAAKSLGVCVGTLENLIRRGWLPAVKIGGKVKIRSSALMKAIKEGCGPQEPRPSQFRKRGKKGRFVSRNLEPMYQAHAGERQRDTLANTSTAKLVKILERRIAQEIDLS